MKFKSLLFRPTFILSRLICKIRSVYYSRKIDEGGGKIIFTDPFISFQIKKQKSASLCIAGKFRVIPHIHGNSPIIISMASNSRLEINGDFSIGQGVRISLSKNSLLTIGGKENESDSGITADSLIMVNKKIEIGKDFICAWNVFISDSDWHQINNQPHQIDVSIGDHVWVANSCSILKGSIIGNNSIVASHSKVINKIYKPDSLLAGIPAIEIKKGISWNRDISI